MSTSSPELAIYVSSYDGCKDVWDTFFSIFHTYWPDCCYNVYLINNEAEYCREGVKVIHTGEEINWFSRTIQSLSALHEDYVVFLLEDYFLSKRVSNDEMASIVSMMDRDGIFFFRLSLPGTQSLSQSGCQSKQVELGSNYAISLQPAIWNRKALLRYLLQIDGASPWDFEYYFNSHKHELPSDDSGKYVKGVLYDSRDLLGYKNGILRGRWIPSTLSYFKKHGIEIEQGDRPSLSFGESLRYSASLQARKLLPAGTRATIKKALVSLKIKYV